MAKVTTEMQCEMGQEYRDPVSGFQGVMVSFTVWQYGCVRITLQPRVDKDGKLCDAINFDDPQLVPVAKNQAKADKAPSQTKQPHGPRDDAAALRRD